MANERKGWAVKIVSPTGTTLFTTERVAKLLLEGGYSLPEVKRKTTRKAPRKTSRKTTSETPPKEDDNSSASVTKDSVQDDSEK